MPTLALTRRLLGWITASLALFLIVASVVVYLSRDAIAHRLAGDWLKARGLDYAIDVRSLSLGGFRGGVRIGDPANPELVIPRVDVAYRIASPFGPTPFKITTQSIRLISPRLRIGWDGRRLQLGSLDKVLAALARQPPDPRAPKPDVFIDHGQARIDTPGGPVRIDADAVISHGLLASLRGRLEPADLNSGSSRIVLSGGPIDATRHGEALAVNAATNLSTTSPGVALDRGAIKISGSFPADTAVFAGPATAGVLFAGSLRTPQAAASDVQAHLNVRGDVSTKPQLPCFAGILEVDGKAGDATIAKTRVQNPRFRADLTSLRVVCASNKISIQTSGAGTIAAAAIGRAGLAGGGLSGSLIVDKLVADLGSSTSVWHANFRSAVAANGVTTSGGRLEQIAATLSGSASDRTLRADMTLSGRGRFAAADAARMAGKIPVLGAEAPYRTAIVGALRGFTLQPVHASLSATTAGASVRLAAPMAIRSDSGGRLDVTPVGAGPTYSTQGAVASGAFGLAVLGGGLPDIQLPSVEWSSRNGAIAARMQLAARLDVLSARGAVLAAGGSATFDHGHFTFDLARCADEAANEILIGGIQATGFAGAVCPASAPLVSSDAHGWRVRGRLEHGAAHLPLPDIQATKGVAAFDVSGDAQGPRAGSVTLDAIETHDAQTPHRFATMASRGRLTLATGVWRGEFETASTTGRLLAQETLWHDLARGLGQAEIDTGALNFAADRLQPTEISPLLDLAKRASGRASFTGQFFWSPAGMTSNGDLTLADLNFISPAGPLTTLAGDVHFTSLAPVSTAPGQKLTVARIEAIVPLEHLETTFALSPTDISVESASMTVADGQISAEPMRVPLASDGALTGAVVIDHVDLGQLIAATSLAQSVKLAAVVDGRVAFASSLQGFEITGGHLVAIKQGRLSILRSALQNVQAPTATSPAVPPNAIQDLAFQAMEDLAFDQLDATLESRPAGRLGILFHIKGRRDPPHKVEVNLKIADLINGKAFKQTIPLPSGVPINLTLDTSLNFREILAALQDFWRGGSFSAKLSSPPIQGQPAKTTPRKGD